MKRLLLAATIVAAVFLPLRDGVSALASHGFPQAATPLTMPEVIVLAKENKLGPVTFHHSDHVTKKYNLAGTGPIACVECHHTAQPAADVAKDPLLHTAWPADRTTTLTAALLTSDPAAVGVINCRQCHVRAGETPQVLPAIPQIKGEDGTEITVTNQVAFHRNCGSCHAQVLKARPDAKCPSPQKCAKCHIK